MSQQWNQQLFKPTSKKAAPRQSKNSNHSQKENNYDAYYADALHLEPKLAVNYKNIKHSCNCGKNCNHILPSFANAYHYPICFKKRNEIAKNLDEPLLQLELFLIQRDNSIANSMGNKTVTMENDNKENYDKKHSIKHGSIEHNLLLNLCDLTKQFIATLQSNDDVFYARTNQTRDDSKYPKDYFAQHIAHIQSNITKLLLSDSLNSNINKNNGNNRVNNINTEYSITKNKMKLLEQCRELTLMYKMGFNWWETMWRIIKTVSTKVASFAGPTFSACFPYVTAVCGVLLTIRCLDNRALQAQRDAQQELTRLLNQNTGEFTAQEIMQRNQRIQQLDVNRQQDRRRRRGIGARIGAGVGMAIGFLGGPGGVVVGGSAGAWIGDAIGDALDG